MPDLTLAARTPGSNPAPGIGLGGRLAAVVLVVSLAALAGACGSSERTAAPASTSGPTSDPATTPVATTPGATTDEQAAGLATYQEFWQVWLRANNPPNPDYPELAQVATGQELDTVKQAAARKLQNGTYTQLPVGSQYHHDATVHSIIQGHAIVGDCWVDDAQIRARQDDQIVNGDVVTELLLSELDLEGGTWRVSNVREQQEWPGIQPCV
jgi:hypothetical protein